jgi:hypothetical protein
MVLHSAFVVTDAYAAFLLVVLLNCTISVLFCILIIQVDTQRDVMVSAGTR